MPFRRGSRGGLHKTLAGVVDFDDRFPIKSLSVTSSGSLVGLRWTKKTGKWFFQSGASTHTLWARSWHTMLKKGFGPILSHPVIIINIIKAKAGESSCVARFTRTVAQEPATCCAGTWFLHDRSGFPRDTFHKDCGAGTGDM